MFSYTVSMEPDNRIFSNACALIDSQVEGAEKEKLLRDVDGSLIQRYSTPSGKIRVLSDYDVYAVYIESDVNLDQVLAQFSTSYGLQSWIKNQVDVLGNTN